MRAEGRGGRLQGTERDDVLRQDHVIAQVFGALFYQRLKTHRDLRLRLISTMR
jgi:hypothetical protein